MSDFAFEIPWLTGRAAVFPPLTADQLDWVLDRWEVVGVVLRVSDSSERNRLDPPAGFELRLRRDGYELFARAAPTE